MITLIGTGHVFDLSSSLLKIFDEKNPDMICVELDYYRYDILLADKGKKEVSCPLCMGIIIVPLVNKTKICPFCRNKFVIMRPTRVPGTSIKINSKNPPTHDKRKYMFILTLLGSVQERLATKYKISAGDEMLTVVNYARSRRISVSYIDMDVVSLFQTMWRIMSRFEKIKFLFIGIGTLFASKKMVESSLKKFHDEYDKYIEAISKHFPMVKKVLIDKRNNYMVNKLMELNEHYQSIITCMGDAHVPGISKLLEEKNIEFKVIRLRELRDGKINGEKIIHEFFYDHGKSVIIKIDCGSTDPKHIEKLLAEYRSEDNPEYHDCCVFLEKYGCYTKVFVPERIIE